MQVKGRSLPWCLDSFSQYSSSIPRIFNWGIFVVLFFRMEHIVIWGITWVNRLHMLLQDDDERPISMKFHPAFIAFAVSVDAFSVSVSFGMLHMNKILFILASGFFAFIFSVAALYFKGLLGMKNGSVLRRFAGVSLLIMGILSCIQ